MFRIVDLMQSIPEIVFQQSAQIFPSEGRFLVRSYEIYFRETVPLDDSKIKGTILFIHGQSFLSSTWLEHSTMQVFSAAGYRCLAFDMPGCGKTGGPSLADAEKPEMITLAIRALNLNSVIIVGHSMAGQYIVPLLGAENVVCIVAIALSNTNTMPSASENINTPVLVVWGENDTSLGPSAASNLSRLPNARLLRIPSAGHACYLSGAISFQSACLNFFDSF